ncbi:hypothetical protein [Lysinibacillus fusiformis]|uniref:hypothetical protein n=1 Tax=Lysinibacillus fusiformis TaxID=28031 RepID=UPI00215A690C|nr:hypothetical protein [Lysinibacillus fusiformis]MCR8853954.1 hypothetical protein [Lysinibacillus fusiformis]WKT79481.1 hypothetical protein QYY55_12015 [Lysinibacillus fusiformis]
MSNPVTKVGDVYIFDKPGITLLQLSPLVAEIKIEVQGGRGGTGGKGAGNDYGKTGENASVLSSRLTLKEVGHDFKISVGKLGVNGVAGVENGGTGGDGGEASTIFIGDILIISSQGGKGGQGGRPRLGGVGGAGKPGKGQNIISPFLTNTYTTTGANILNGLVKITVLKMNLGKGFIYHNGEYKKWNQTINESNKISLIPILTSNTSSAGNAIMFKENDKNYPAWKAFDGRKTLADAGISYGRLAYCLGASGQPFIGFKFNEKKKINSYKITSACVWQNGAVIDTGHTNNFVFEASNDGINWIILDTQNNAGFTLPYTSKEFIFNNFESYFQYRVRSLTTAISINELEMYQLEIDYYWSTVFTILPDINHFKEQGMDPLSPLFDRIKIECDPIPMIKLSSEYKVCINE